jgi:hypothetical protein
VKSSQGKHNKSALLILEEAVHFLRLAPTTLILSYYVGSLPFILGLLYFWTDMSRYGYAADHLAVGSLGIALLFAWMKFWHAVFGMQIRSKLFGTSQQSWSLYRFFSLAASQTLIHSTGLFVLPLAALLMVPFGWCYTFYQNATVQVDSNMHGFRDMCKKAWRQAQLWPLQNHTLIAIFFLFGLVILFNISIAILVLPYLLKKFTGIETVFTLSGFHVVNTTFAAAVLAISYFCLDPLIKTAYALRCFYGEALNSGADLKTELHSFRIKRKIIFVFLILTSFILPYHVRGSEQIILSPTELSRIPSKKFERSIEEVLERREFAWRLPREKQQVEESKKTGPLVSVMRWVLDVLEKVVKTISGWVQRLNDWLDKMWPEKNNDVLSEHYDWRSLVKYLMILLLIVLTAALVFYLVKLWRKHRTSEGQIESEAVEQAPDLRDEGIKADELPANSWLDLAKELMAKGALRLAMRALYLATLAFLAEKELITIEIYKSNRDYQTELDRRVHPKKDLLNAFSKTVTVFECVWYGMYKINRCDVDRYLIDQERIMALAEK